MQKTLPSQVDFKNAPVLFKEGGKSYQQVIASYPAEKLGKIVITRDRKEILKADLIKGMNRFLLTVPAVTVLLLTLKALKKVLTVLRKVSNWR